MHSAVGKLQKELVGKVSEAVHELFQRDGDPYHDEEHVRRVVHTARRIHEMEGGNLFIILLAALVHDVGDWKFRNGDQTAGPREAKELLEAQGIDSSVIEQVCEIVATISFKGEGVPTPMKTLEGKIVQDADRLDAMGAIGIARVFAYGGSKLRPLYDANLPHRTHNTPEAYFNSNPPAVHHFYEKLLLLVDRLNTPTGKSFGRRRHKIMVEFLANLEAEVGHKLY